MTKKVMAVATAVNAEDANRQARIQAAMEGAILQALEDGVPMGEGVDEVKRRITEAREAVLAEMQKEVLITTLLMDPPNGGRIRRDGKKSWTERVKKSREQLEKMSLDKLENLRDGDA